MLMVLTLVGALVWLSVILVVIGACRSASRGDRYLLRERVLQTQLVFADIVESSPAPARRTLEHA